jgi:V/A-type H+-transporting ATPase subunit C
MLEHTITALDPTQLSQAIIRIDEALRRDLTQSLAKLRHFFSNHSLELVNALVLRWDVYNLKTVIRGKRASAQVEEILTATLPVGILDDIALAELARVPTLQAVANLLETWRLPLAHPVRIGLILLGESDTLQPLEFELDRFTYMHTSRLVADGDDHDRVAGDYLQFLVDKTNLLTALRYLAERSALSPIEAGRQFLKANGRLTRSHYEAVVSAHDLRDGLARLTETPYRWLAGTFAEGETISLPLIERKLDRLAIRKAVNLSRQDPLGIGVAIAYLERKTNEIRNLRMILRGKASGMSREQIVEWVIV